MAEVVESHEAVLRRDIASFVHKPYAHALYVYPWGQPGSPLEQYDGPRDWQAEELKALGEHLRNPETCFTPYRCAIASGHGIGKSALIGMIVKWALDTFEDTRVLVTAGTEPQLSTRTGPEIGKWCGMACTAHWFDVKSTRVQAHGEHAATWRADLQPWSVHRPEAFQGLHNLRKRIVVIMDEASAVDDKIWEVIEGALTDEETELIWIAFGNPTRSNGRFRECFRRYKKSWRTRNIDSRAVDGTNKTYLQSIIDQYGEDSDQARIRVMGQFPNVSAYQLLATKDVEAAQARVLKPEQFNFAAKIISVDPAWTGTDDFVIGLRQGLDFRVLEVHPYNDNDVQMANRIARLEDEHEADAVFIDAGYGTGILSVGGTIGRVWLGVWFSEKAGREDCINKRAEMYLDLRDWLKLGGSISDKDQELHDELVSITTVPRLDGKYQLASKEQTKEELGWSPNRADCLAISFAFPVPIKEQRDAIGLPLDWTRHAKKRRGDYNPIDRV